MTMLTEMNLRSARKLEQKIQRYLADNPVTQRVVVSAFDENWNDELEMAKREAFNAITSNGRLVDIRHTIRSEIRAANEVSGVNELIATRRALLDKISIIEQAMSHRVDDKESVSIAKLKALAEKGEVSNSYSSSDSVTFNTISEETLTKLKEETLQMKNTVEQLDEEIHNKNVTVVISVENEDIAFLRGLNVT